MTLSGDLLQDALVTLVALGAAGVLVRKFTAMFGSTPERGASCSNCPSSSSRPKARPSPEPQPIAFLRK